ncbi:MAG: hypothetical protein Q9195_002468 [Heterodermia aff. obscurata]
MKRKSDQPHVEHEKRMHTLDKEDIVAILETRIEELSSAGYLVRKSDDSLKRTTEISPIELPCIDHRKRLKSVSSSESEQCGDVSHFHSSHRTRDGPVKHIYHCNHLVDESYGTVQALARSSELPGSEHSSAESLSGVHRRRSTSTASSLSSPSDSEPATPTPITLAPSKASNTVPFHEHTIIRETSREVVAPAQTSLHYRKDSVFHSEEIDFQKYNKDNKDSQTIVNDVLEIIKTPAKCNSKRNLYQDGFIYVLHDPNIPGYVKIGRTAKCPTRRKKQIATCSRMKVDFVGSQRLIIGPYHERLEQIIHADLYNERHYFECACSANRTHTSTHESDNFTKHGEWFRIDAEEAENRVEQWRNWMRQEPYKKPGSAGAGELKSDFRRRVQYLYEHPSTIPEERWTTFMMPFYMAERDQETLNLLT